MSNRCYRKELVTCFGMPIDENPTVLCMEAAFSQLGLPYLYNGALVRPEDLEAAVRSIKALHMKGANVTVPHKVAVMQYLDEIEDDAAFIGAVNTIYWKDDKVCGANTDGKGFVASMEQAALPIAGKRFVILGAGGAAKAIAVELALAKAAQITIVNRTLQKAQELAARINQRTDCKAVALSWDGAYCVPGETDFLVNCTDIGLFPDTAVPNIQYDRLSKDLVVCDVVPNPPQTRFLQLAQQQGCRTFDGLSMLVNQGIIALQLWSGLEADPGPMKAALAAEFQGAGD